MTIANVRPWKSSTDSQKRSPTQPANLEISGPDEDRLGKDPTANGISTGRTGQTHASPQPLVGSTPRKNLTGGADFRRP